MSAKENKALARRWFEEANKGEAAFMRALSRDRPLRSSEIFPHLLRAERASQLASEYSFDVYGLRQFLGWKPRKQDMAEKYASLDWKGLARRMGVTV
jgi:hypothetical protein